MIELIGLRECAVGQRGVTWDYNDRGEPEMNEYGKTQLDAYLMGDRSADNYFYQWGGTYGLPNNWPILEENMLHPDGWPLDFYMLRYSTEGFDEVNIRVRKES